MPAGFPHHTDSSAMNPLPGIEGSRLTRATAAFREKDLRYRVSQKLMEWIADDFRRDAYVDSLESLGYNDQYRFDDAKSWILKFADSWEKELRDYFIEHPWLFIPEGGQQQQQQQQQIQQQVEQQRYQQQQEQQVQQQARRQLPYATIIYSFNRELANEVKQRRDHDGEILQVISDSCGGSGPVPSKPPSQDKVTFGVYAPKAVSRDEPFLLDAWCFLESQRAKVESQALRRGRISAGDDTGSVIERFSLLSIRVDSPFLEVEREQRVFVWEGHETLESFPCRIRAEHEWLHTVTGKLTVRMGGVHLATIIFEIPVAPSADSDRMEASRSRREPRTAFASYASEDRIDVMRGLEGIRKGAPHLEIKDDVESLRSGDNWETKLDAFISTSDIFYLFWSSSAARSRWVDHEWRLALRLKGIDFIDPFPLESPELVPPPAPLSSLHFHSLYVAIIHGEQMIRKLKAEREAGAPNG